MNVNSRLRQNRPDKRLFVVNKASQKMNGLEFAVPPLSRQVLRVLKSFLRLDGETIEWLHHFCIYRFLYHIFWHSASASAKFYFFFLKILAMRFSASSISLSFVGAPKLKRKLSDARSFLNPKAAMT